MWRLNCPASEVLMTEKRSSAISKAATSVSNEVPRVLLSQAATCAHSAPIHDNMRLGGISALLGPKRTVSMMKCLQKKAAMPMSTMASAPRTRWGAEGVDVLEEGHLRGSASGCFMLWRAVGVSDSPVEGYFSGSFSTDSCFRAGFFGRGALFGGVVLVDGILELLDAASEAAHQLGNLAPSEEQDDDQNDDDELGHSNCATGDEHIFCVLVFCGWGRSPPPEKTDWGVRRPIRCKDSINLHKNGCSDGKTCGFSLPERPFFARSRETLRRIMRPSGIAAGFCGHPPVRGQEWRRASSRSRSAIEHPVASSSTSRW